jgi:hypothetical protein
VCDRSYKDKVQYVFEDGTYGRGQVNEWFRAIARTPELREMHRYGGVSFQPKGLKPLHAADFVAYDLGRYSLDVRLGRQRPDVIKIYQEYIAGKNEESPRWINYWDRELLQPFFDNWKWEGDLASKNE